MNPEPPSRGASSMLTGEQEAVLREAGSFVAEMPPVLERASTTAPVAQDTADVCDDLAGVPGWDLVAASFPANAHPVAIASFANLPSDELIVGEDEQSPVVWLRGGGDPQVVARLVHAVFKVRT